MFSIIMTINKDIIPAKSCSPNDLLRAKIIYAAIHSIKHNSLFSALENAIESGYISICAYAKEDKIDINDTLLSFKIKMFDFLTYETNQLDDYYFCRLHWYFQGCETVLDKSIIRKNIKPYVEQFKANIKDLENRTIK